MTRGETVEAAERLGTKRNFTVFSSFFEALTLEFRSSTGVTSEASSGTSMAMPAALPSPGGRPERRTMVGAAHVNSVLEKLVET